MPSRTAVGLSVYFSHIAKIACPAVHAKPSPHLGGRSCLALQALLHRLVDRLAARFFRYRPVTLAKVLEGMGTVAAVQLLGRDDLCCPLECFLVEVGVTPTHTLSTNIQSGLFLCHWQASCSSCLVLSC